MQGLDGYPSDLTIESLLLKGHWEGRIAEHWKRIGNIRLNGIPLLSQPYRFRTPSPNERRLSKRWSEVLSVARVFAFYEHDASLTLCDPPLPDIQASTKHDGDVAIEAVEITDSTRSTAIIDQLQASIEDKIADQKYSLDYAYWFTFPRNKRPRSSDIPNLVAEMMIVISNGGQFRDMHPDPIQYPFLAKFDFRIGTSIGSRVSIGDGGGGYTPNTLVAVAEKRLKEKQAKAKDYRTSLPLWLVMNLTDQHGIYYESVQTFAESEPSHEPFEQVHIIYREMLMTLDKRFGGWTRLILKSDRRRI